MRVRFYSILVCLVLFSSAHSQINITDRSSYSVEGNTLLLEESNGPISINQAWQHYIQHEFKIAPVRNNELNLGLVKHVFWIAIPLKNLKSGKNLEAGVANGSMAHVEFYLLSVPDGRVLQQHVTGDMFDYNSRSVDDRHFYFDLRPLVDNAVIFYRIDMRGRNFFVPLRIVTSDFRIGQNVKINAYYGFFSGFLIFVSFFSLIAYVLTRHSVYLFYSLYVLSYCLFFLADGDLDFKWLYPHLPQLGAVTPILYGLGINFSMLLFTNEFLQLKKVSKKLPVVIYSWVALIFIAMGLLFYGHVFTMFMPLRLFIYYYCLVVISGSWVIQIFSITLQMRNGFKPAFLYAAALFGVFFTACLYVIHSYGLISNIVPTYIYVPIGFSTEIVILSFALVYNYNFLEKKHQELSIRLTRQQLTFSQQLLQVQDDEQKRIAQDLHDELGGNLAVIKMNLQELKTENSNDGEESVAKIIQMVDKVSDNARHIAHNLMPPEFENTKLDVLLKNFFSKINNENSVRFYFHFPPGEDRFEKQDELMIYRVILELTNNILRHSQASEATVQFIYYDTYLEIMAEDNGKGFGDSTVDGMGIKNIQSRVNYLQGQIDIDSGIRGTTIVIKVPYKK